MKKYQLQKHNKEYLKIAIFGASGLSKEVADICIDCGYREIFFIGEDKKNENKQNGSFGYIVENKKEIYSMSDSGYVFAIGIGDNNTRRQLFEKYRDLRYVNVVHPSATFGYKQYEEIEKTFGNIIAAGTRFTNNIKIGNFGIYNLNCTIGHDCIIENYINIAPGVNISGNVFVSEGAFIGTNSTILQGRSIEKKLIIGMFSTIAAGSIISKNIPDNTTALGIKGHLFFLKK